MAINLKGRSFLTLEDFTPAEIRYLLDLGHDLKAKRRAGICDPTLQGKHIVLLFEKTSTRTRCSFEVAGPQELAKEMDGTLVKRVFATARENGGLIEITDNMNSLKDADVIYGDIWASMGEEDLIPERAKLLTPYRVTEETLKATGNSNVLYLHCLPSFHDF